jgi:hypothetical protein
MALASDGKGDSRTVKNIPMTAIEQNIGGVPYRHGGGWSKKINAWYLNTLMVYL